MRMEQAALGFATSHASAVPALCIATGANLTPDEAQVVKALSPREVSRLCDAGSHRAASRVDAAMVLASSIAIQIPVEPMKAVSESSGDLAYLPRLPYPVTLFELYDEDGDHNRFSWSRTRDGIAEIIAISVAETEPGIEWATWAFFATSSDIIPLPQFGALLMRIVSDGKCVTLVGPDPQDNPEWMPEDLAACCQLATARGAVTTEIQHVSRQVRRAAERKLGWKPPRMYHLDIGGSYDPEHRDGHREYTCRWLVRGHWRTEPSGRRTWIRPYIKGPIGAPFRGRPSYTVIIPEPAAPPL